MTRPAFFEFLAGHWRGDYTLWINEPAPASESAATAVGRFAAGAYLLFEYTWAFQGAPESGVFLLGVAGNQASATWGDSWHMAPAPMPCAGDLTDDGDRLVLMGHYGAGPDQPDWGWRTTFTRAAPDRLVMEAFNIAPDGREWPAVRAQLTRAATPQN